MKSGKLPLKDAESSAMTGMDVPKHLKKRLHEIIRELVVLEKPRSAIVRGLRKLRCPNPELLASLSAHTIVAVMRK